MHFLKLFGLVFLMLLSLSAIFAGAGLALSAVNPFFEGLMAIEGASVIIPVLEFLGGLAICSAGVVGVAWSFATVKYID
ncbi:MAG TPA: hypothetical protein VF837_02250 [Patescibacteria group bacterium]